MFENLEAEIVEINNDYIKQRRLIEASGIKQVYKDIFYKTLYRDMMAEHWNAVEAERRVERLGLIL